MSASHPKLVQAIHQIATSESGTKPQGRLGGAGAQPPLTMKESQASAYYILYIIYPYRLLLSPNTLVHIQSTSNPNLSMNNQIRPPIEI